MTFRPSYHIIILINVKFSVYYRVYDQDGILNSKGAFNNTDATLGRVAIDSITPPRNVRSIKHRIAKQEGLANHSSISVTRDLDTDEPPAEDDDHLDLGGHWLYGETPKHPIGIITSTPEENGSDDKPNAVDRTLLFHSL